MHASNRLFPANCEFSETLELLHAYLHPSRTPFTHFLSEHILDRDHYLNPSSHVCLSVGPSVYMSVEITETITARLLGLSMQMHRLPVQRQFVRMRRIISIGPYNTNL